MNQPIILVSEREEDFVFAAEVARQCETDLVLVSEFTKVLELEQKAGGVQALFVGLSTMDMINSLNSVGSKFLNRNEIHAIVSPSDNEVTLAAFGSPKIGSVVINRFSSALVDGQYYSRIVKLTKASVCNGLGSILNARGGIQTVRLTDSAQKGLAANAVAFHLREFKCNERIARTVAGAVDELLMNAMFDAPVGGNGERLHDRTPRRQRIETEGVEMQIGIEDEIVAVTVCDTAGSLDRDTVLSHISKCYDNQLNRVRGPDYEGAGIGLALVIRSGGSIAFVCEPGKRTEVTVFFRQAERFKDFKNPFQFVATSVARR